MLTATELDTLLAQARSDPDNRPIVADALEEAGREAEARLLRSPHEVRYYHYSRTRYRGDCRVEADPEPLIRQSELTALDGDNYEHRTRIVTSPLNHDWPEEGVQDPDDVDAWIEWLDRVHAADCRLWELRMILGGDAVEDALERADAMGADWEHLPAALENAVAELEDIHRGIAE